MIRYSTGDATIADTNKTIAIAHIVNDIGKFGAGFSGALEKRFPDECAEYRQHWAIYEGGQIMACRNDNVWVIHMFAQHGVRSKANPVPLRTDWLETCLHKLNNLCKIANIDYVQMPKIGSGLAGGNWEDIEPIIANTLTRPMIVTIKTQE